MNKLALRGILTAGWIGTTVIGWFLLLQHTYQPATTGATVHHWPGGALSGSTRTEFQIVVFAHPFCPCTRATFHKIDESLTRFPADVSIRVVFETSGLPESEVEDSSNVAFARRLNRTEVLFDRSGSQANRFGATVSGEVFAFDSRGRRLFHGGLTTGRGHLGDSVGQQQLERLACGGSHEVYNGPVFGCALPRTSTENGI